MRQVRLMNNSQKKCFQVTQKRYTCLVFSLVHYCDTSLIFI